MVVAMLALVTALTSTAYAAVVITGRNVRDHSLTGRDLRSGSVGRRVVQAGAGVDVRYVAKTFREAPGILAGGEAVCPRRYVAISGGVAGLSPTPGAQTVNTSLPLDGNDRDKVPDRYAGYVHNGSNVAQNFEVDAVCARVGSAVSNFVQTRAASVRSPRPTSPPTYAKHGNVR